MPTTKQTAALLIALMTFCSADVSQAGLFNWWRRPAPQPTTVGYYPATGVYQGAGPAASYYTSNYAPNYQAVNYPPASYPAPGYRTANYPPANYRTTNYPPANYQPVVPGMQPAPARTVARAPSYNTVYRSPVKWRLPSARDNVLPSAADDLLSRPDHDVLPCGSADCLPAGQLLRTDHVLLRASRIHELSTRDRLSAGPSGAAATILVRRPLPLGNRL